LSIDGKITGTGNITLTGQRLTMSSAVQNDFVGSFTVSAGSILQSGSNVNLAFAQSHNLIVNGDWRLYSANPSINSLTGSGTVTTYSGSPLLSIGNNNGGGVFSGVMSGALSLTKNGTGTQILSGANSYTGTTTISGGVLQIGNGGTTGALGTGVITNNAALVFNRTDAALVVGAKISGTGTVTQAGTGTTTLSANNDWSGSATVSAGTLQIGNGGTTGTLGTSTTVTSNGTLAFKRSDNISVGQKITGTGGLTQAGTGKVTLIDAANLHGVNDYSGVTTIVAGGTLEVGNGGTTGNLGTGTITNNGSLIINRSDAVAIGQVISGSGSLSQSGSGTTTLSGINTYSGGTSVVTGILKIGDGTNNGQIGSNTVNIASGALLDFDVKASSSANYSTTNTFTGTGTLKKSGAGSLTWGSASGVFAMTGGLIDVQAGSFIGSNSGNEVWTNNKASLNVAAGAVFAGVEGNIIVDALTGGGAVTSGYPGFAYGLTVGVNNGSGTFSGAIQDSHGQSAKLTKTGTGTQILTGANSYTGVTTVSGGVLQVGNGGTSGTLGSGAVVDNASLVFNRSDALLVSNAISGTGTLTQAGAGTTTLAADNSYGGTTAVSGGTLQVGNGGSTGTLGAGAVTLSNNALLSYVRAADTSMSNNISGTGSVSASITGVGSDLTVSNAITLTGGTANLAADGNLTVTQSIDTTNTGSAAVVLNAGKALGAGDASGGNIVFSGSGAVSVSGSGRATLFTGSVAGSTGLGVVAGNNRFNSDELSSGYTTALGSGTYAVYREAPTLAVAFDNALKTYDGLVFAGGATQVLGWVGNDSVAQLGSLNYSGTAQGAVNAGVYSISGTAPSASAIGYNVTYTPGSLTVDRASLTASLTGPISKEYDGTHAASGLTGANFVITGWASPNGVTEGATVAQTLATYISKNVPDNTGAGTVTATLSTADFTPTGNTSLSNYVLPTSASGNVGNITRAPLAVNVGNTAMFVTQDPNTAFDTGMTYVGLKNGETSSAVLGGLTRAYNGVANPGIGNYTGVYGLSAVPTAANYTVTVTPGNLEVLAADKLLIQVGSQSQTYGAVTASNAGVTTAAQGVSALYCEGGVTCNTISALSLTDLGSGNWRATDTLGSSIRFSTLVDVSGVISPAGYLSVGNHDYSVGSLTVEGGQNFTSMALAGGALTITPKALSLTAPNVTKVYDGSDRLAGMSLTPSGALAGDVVTALASGGTFAGQNAGAQTYTLSGLQLQGADKANYSLSPEPVSGTGSITPKTLSLSAWALNKTFDGTTSATVNLGALTGLVGSEQLGVSGLGLFANADVGYDKAVFATYSLADGANGGLASNYVLAPQTLMASILKKDEAAPVPVPAGLTGRERPVSRPVQPEAWPQTSSHKSTRLVYQPSPAASVSQPALGRTESGPCSDQPADGCVCQDSPLAGIQICYVPKGALDNEPTQTAKSGQVARR
jgi:autotransporter-associated beta strand protein